MGSCLRRHRFALVTATVAAFLGSAGLDHHSPARAWIVRAAVFGAITLAAHAACSSQIERIDQAFGHQWSRAITVVAAIVGSAAAQVGDGAIVVFAGVVVGAVIALDRADLILKRYR